MTMNGVAERACEQSVEVSEQAAVEALLFTSLEPVSAKELADAVGVDQSKVRSILNQLAADAEAPHRGLQLVSVAGGYRLATKPVVAEVLRRYRQQTSAVRLSKAALETLAIVAYKQPAIRAEVEGIRGVDCAGVLKTLLEYRLIKIVGRRDVVGRPIVYGTTREFLEFFGLNDLSALPTLKEFEDLARHDPPSSPNAVVPDHEASDADQFVVS